ncbi:type IV conjugative transfer system pilin TraA [Enterobacter asburiae]
MENSVVPPQGKPSRLKQTFSKISLLKAAKVVLPVMAVGMLFPGLAHAGGGTDLLQPGDATVGATFGSKSSAVKWVILAEVMVGAVMYMTTKNLKFLSGFIIISVLISVGMKVAGY